MSLFPCFEVNQFSGSDITFKVKRYSVYFMSVTPPMLIVLKLQVFLSSSEDCAVDLDIHYENTPIEIY